MANAQLAAPAAPGLDRVGLAAAVSAYLLWGFLPIYLKMLAPAGPLEVLAHRALWALPTMAIALACVGRLRAALAQVARPAALGALAATALLIAVNWLIYIYAVQYGRVLEASLGYYINPLVSVALGVLVLRERLSLTGWIALGLAATGVVNQIVLVGEPPFISLALAFSFAAYGYLRKVAKVDAGPGLLAETALLAPFAIAGIVWFEATGSGHAFDGARLASLLVLAGPVTALPLFLFALGARRLPLVAIGILQFIAPSIQFAVALAYGETFTPAHAVTFAFVWAALVVFTRDLFVRAHAGAKTRP
jgi:chloramphenicol-sensitive protein RarD